MLSGDSLRNQVDLADAELAQLKQLCDRGGAAGALIPFPSGVTR